MIHFKPGISPSMRMVYNLHLPDVFAITLLFTDIINIVSAILIKIFNGLVISNFMH